LPTGSGKEHKRLLTMILAVRDAIASVIISLFSHLSPSETFLLVAGPIFGIRNERAVANGPDSEEDGDYVRLVQDGDRDAYLYLFNKYSDRIYYFCYRRLSQRREPEEDARDATTSAFTKCFQNIYRLKDPNSFRSYLFTTAHNTCMDFLKDMQTFDDPKITGDSSGESGNSDNQSASSGVQGPEEQAMTSEIERDVQSAVNALQENYREAIHLVHLEGLSYKEAADIMGVKEDDIRRWVHRGLLKLRRALHKHKRSAT
jgi:RNA polymerase sigma factor (sigma-70 family)